MSGKGKLTSLLTEQPINTKKIIDYARSKHFSSEDLVSIAMSYPSLVMELGPDVNPLHVACIRYRPDLVKALIQEGYDVNAEFENIDSYLRISIDYGNIPVTHLLLDLGADPHHMNKDGKTLMEAAMSKNITEKTRVTALNVLLEAGVSVNAVAIQETKEKPLHIAVSCNLPLCTSFLLQKGADGNATDVHGCTPLHYACYRNYVQMIKMLTLHKVKLYKENVILDTPLLIVVKSFFKEALNALIEGGCDINKAMVGGSCTAIHYATEDCHFEKVKYLVSLGADINSKLRNKATPLHVLASRTRSQNTALEKTKVLASFDILQFLVEKGANIDAVNDQNYTPLRLALMNKYLRLAKQLIKLNANLNFQRCCSGKTIFHIISSMNHDIIVLALEYGADWSKKNRAGLTPYHCAIMSKVDLRFIKTFIQFGCPYNQDVPVWRKSKMGGLDVYRLFFKFQEQFFRGIRENSITLVKEAVEKGAVVRGCSEGCAYPLHLVANKGHHPILQFLLENGFPPNTVNNEGETALYVAAKRGHYDVCCTLLRFGACYDCHSKKCCTTPKTIAAMNGHESVVGLFKRVARKFHLASMEDKYIIRDLMIVLSGSYSDYLMYVNAINNKAETLMATALRFNHFENAKLMMELRNFASLNFQSPRISVAKHV